MAGELWRCPVTALERLDGYEGVADVIKLSPPTHYVPEEVTRLAQAATLEMFAT